MADKYKSKGKFDRSNVWDWCTILCEV